MPPALQQPKKKKPTKWANSRAKKLLRADIIAGHCDNKGPTEVYQMRECYQEYVFENFSNNLRNLRERIRQDQALVDIDAAGVAHDIELYPRPENSHHGYPRWNGSDAQNALRLRIVSGQHENMSPQQIHASDPAFAVYPLGFFRNHIYQELWARTERAYWRGFWAARRALHEPEEDV